MCDGYIIECPPMESLYWNFVQLKFPDEPDEIHSSNSHALRILNKHLAAINCYLRDFLDACDVCLTLDEFKTRALDNHPPHIDDEVLWLYLDSAEIFIPLLAGVEEKNIVLIDKIGSTAVIME